MSRRRATSPRNNKHLERTEEVSAVVQQTLDEHASVGPCPGRCNTAHRRWAKERDELTADLVAASAAVERAQASERVDAAARVTVAQAWMFAAQQSLERLGQRREPKERAGRPVWCWQCSADIANYVEALPKLVAWTLDIGAPVTKITPGLVLGTVEVPGRTVESLECGHRHTRAGYGPAPLRRWCMTCVAATIEGAPGVLAPTSKASRVTSSGKARVSPAGSPAWVEVDEAMEWVCGRAGQIRDLLGDAPRSYAGRFTRPAVRFRESVDAAGYLTDNLGRVLQCSLATTVGKEALAIGSRLTRVSGMDLLVHQLEGWCPNEQCGYRSLQRADGSAHVRCVRCGSSWDEELYGHLSRVQAQEMTERAERAKETAS